MMYIIYIFSSCISFSLFKSVESRFLCKQSHFFPLPGPGLLPGCRLAEELRGPTLGAGIPRPPGHARKAGPHCAGGFRLPHVHGAVVWGTDIAQVGGFFLKLFPFIDLTN